MVQSTPKADWLRQMREKGSTSVTAPSTEAKTCKACIEYRKHITALEAQLKALKDTNKDSNMLESNTNKDSNKDSNIDSNGFDAREYQRQYMKDSRAAKKAGLTIQEYRNQKG